ncbi:MAG: ATP phosphoribosyltransferase, partial [Caulobacterales bacterium]
PSKGRLQEQAAEFFRDCGLPLSQDGGARGYTASFRAMPEIDVRLISAGEIARALKVGEIHAGIVGEDGLRENDPDLSSSFLIKKLGFGRADLVVAAPDAWLDVATMADFAEVARLHRNRTGERLRVATKYLNLAHRFLDARGVADYRLVESAGATEGAPASGLAEAVVDITTTGATLAANHLRVLSDGVILKSEANLAVSRVRPWGGEARESFKALLDVIQARSRAKEVRLLRLAPGPQGAEPMIARAAQLGCKLAGSPEGALLELYCPAENVFAVCSALQGLIGGSIGVFEADFVFEQPNMLIRAFEISLRSQS